MTSKQALTVSHRDHWSSPGEKQTKHQLRAHGHPAATAWGPTEGQLFPTEEQSVLTEEH